MVKMCACVTRPTQGARITIATRSIALLPTTAIHSAIQCIRGARSRIGHHAFKTLFLHCDSVRMERVLKKRDPYTV